MEICQNTAGQTDLVTECRDHDGPSWTPSSHTCAISIAALFITVDCRYDRSSQSQRSVEDIHSKTLELLEFGQWDYFSDLHDEPAGRTFMAMTVHPTFRNPTLGHTSPSSFSSYTTMPPMDCHGHDGLSWSRRTITVTTDRHKLRRWYFSAFLAQKTLHSSFRQISCK